MGVENYVATLKLTPVTEGNRPSPSGGPSSTAPPSASAQLAEQIGQGVFQAAFDSLKKVVCRSVIRVSPVRGDRRADRARLGGAARLQQPLAPGIPRSAIRASSAASRADQVGCVRNFTLKDGNHIREQLLALSDRDYVSTYCILDATLPMRNYVATVQLKRVTDGERTFWHWESTFDVPTRPRARVRAARRRRGVRGRLRGPARRS